MADITRFVLRMGALLLAGVALFHMYLEDYARSAACGALGALLLLAAIDSKEDHRG